MLNWKTFNVGSEDAVADRKNLPDAFIHTEHFEKAKTNEIRLIVGRKGTGKTALFQEMEIFYSESPKHKTISIGEENISQLLADAREARSNLDDVDVNTDTVFEKLWETLILSECIRILISDSEVRNSDEAAVLKKTQSAFREDINSIKEIRKIVQDILSSFKKTIVVLIDDIDRGMRIGGEEEDIKDIYALSAGLYLILHRYRTNDNIQIKAFMPADIFEYLCMKDADKFEPDHKLELRWQRSDLLAMIERRISLSYGIDRYDELQLWNELFPPTLITYFYGFRPAKKYLSRERASWDVILEHTFWRPRDFITICRKIKDEAIKNNVESIDQALIETSIDELSSNAFRFFINEAGYRIKSLETILSQFRNMTQSMTYDTFRGNIASKGPGKGLLPEKIDELMKLLYIFGFYGIGERKVFSSPDDSNTTNFIVKFYHETAVSQIGSPYRGIVVIHPIFSHVLSLSPGSERIECQ